MSKFTQNYKICQEKSLQLAQSSALCDFFVRGKPFSSCHRLYLCQKVAELPIVDLHTVIQVQADSLVGIVAQWEFGGLTSIIEYG